MDSLPPVELGAVLLAALAAMWLLRAALQPRAVLAGDILRRPRRQLLLELALYPAAGVLAYGLLASLHGFPLRSGLNLVVGFAALGLFLGLDMSLARERMGIHLAAAHGWTTPPRRLFPMTRAFLLFALVLALLAAVVLALILMRDLSLLEAGELTREVVLELFFVMLALFALSANLIWSFSRNLKLLFSVQTRVLEQVQRGDLSGLAPVATANEFGLIAARTNEMIHGLRHRVELLSALSVARDVQQELMPRQDPGLEGVEAAGANVSCDAIGGDCFDFLTTPRGTLWASVADVAGHGVGPALLMASFRAMLRSAAARHADLGQAVQEVNRLLYPDVAASGRFVTLFLMEVDPAVRELRYVRAGHDPAMLASPEAGLQELTTPGMALGVLEDSVYTMSRTTYEPGSLAACSTDGVWEARSAAGETYGKPRLESLVAEQAASPAQAVVDAVLADHRRFLAGAEAQDDATIIAVKLL